MGLIYLTIIIMIPVNMSGGGVYLYRYDFPYNWDELSFYRPSKKGYSIYEVFFEKVKEV